MGIEEFGAKLRKEKGFLIAKMAYKQAVNDTLRIVLQASQAEFPGVFIETETRKAESAYLQKFNESEIW